MRNCKCYCNLAGTDFPKCLLLLWMVLNKEVLNMSDTALRLVIFCSEKKKLQFMPRKELLQFQEISFWVLGFLSLKYFSSLSFYSYYSFSCLLWLQLMLFCHFHLVHSVVIALVTFYFLTGDQHYNFPSIEHLPKHLDSIS